MSAMTGHAALWALAWGLIGGLIYAAPRLATAFWGASEATAGMRRLAIVEFGMNLIAAPAVAYALAPTVSVWFGENVTPAAIALALGYSATRVIKKLAAATERRLSHQTPE